MKCVTLLIVGVLLVSNSKSLLAQEAAYVPEKDRQVLKKLDDWQNMKFGLLMHWGPYSQWGIVESWSICSEDVDWCRRPKGISYVDYVKKYEELPKTFNPINFDPERWARAAMQAQIATSCRTPCASMSLPRPCAMTSPRSITMYSSASSSAKS